MQNKWRRHVAVRWLLKGVLVIGVFVVALLASGALYEALSEPGDSQRFPPPGQMVGDPAMHLYCTGNGIPTVIFEASFGAYSESWILVQRQVSQFTRACSYDRAGMGWSTPDPTAPTPEYIAQNLHAVLLKAGIPGPYILVGHSMGGKSIRLFAAAYPDAVKGVVFVDARHESMEPAVTPEMNAANRAAYESSLGLYRVLRQAGIVRVFGLGLGRSVDPAMRFYPDAVAYRMVLFAVRESTLQTMIAESRYSAASDDLLQRSPLPDKLPIYVLTAEESLETPGWKEAQARLAALSSNSQWTIVPKSSHALPAEQPDVVNRAIRAVYDAIQNGESVKGIK